MHFITGKHLERRSFLRGMSAAVALPFLDAMVPAARPWRDPAAEAGQTRLICMEEAMGCAWRQPVGLLSEPLRAQHPGPGLRARPREPAPTGRGLSRVLDRGQQHGLPDG